MTPELNRPLPRDWWLHKPAYFKFMVRELTSLAVLAYTLLIIWALWASAESSSIAASKNTSLAVVATGIADREVVVEWRGEERVDPDRIAWNLGLVFVLVWIVLAIWVLA